MVALIFLFSFSAKSVDSGSRSCIGPEKKRPNFAECVSLLSGHFGPATSVNLLQRMLAKIFPDELWRELEAGQHLLFSPHAEVRGLPIHAFDLGTEEYVIQRWPVQYVPTLSMALLDRSKAVTDRGAADGVPHHSAQSC